VEGGPSQKPSAEKHYCLLTWTDMLYTDTTAQMTTVTKSSWYIQW